MEVRASPSSSRIRALADEREHLRNIPHCSVRTGTPGQRDLESHGASPPSQNVVGLGQDNQTPSTER